MHEPTEQRIHKRRETPICNEPQKKKKKLLGFYYETYN